MPAEFPAHVYHESGAHQVVHNAQQLKALGDGWTDKPAEHHHAAIRMASGGVSEVIVPVTRTRAESI